jgi:hypothetical protein
VLENLINGPTGMMIMTNSAATTQQKHAHMMMNNVLPEIWE